MQEYRGILQVKKVQGLILFEPGDICHNSLGYWTDLLAGILNDKKIETVRIPIINDLEKMKENMRMILKEKDINAALTFNASPGFVFFAELFREFRVSFYNYIVDHPIFHHSSLSNVFEGYHVICIDRDHQRFIQKYYREINGVYFLPLAGIGGDVEQESYTSFLKRPYDIIFTGNLANTGEMIYNLSLYPAEQRELYLKWIEYMLLHSELSPEKALEMLIKDAGGDFSDDQFLNLASMLKESISFVRNFIREEVISALLEKDIPIHIFGSGWDVIKEKYPTKSSYFHTDVSIEKTIQLNGESKLVLNILPWFKDGTHDRIETAQLNGAAVITDDNEYLHSIYKENESVYFYQSSSTVSLPDRIKEILSDSKSLYETAQRGHKIAQQEMTWYSLADKLYEILF